MEGLIQKAESRYKITDEDFDTMFRIAEFKEKVKHRWIHDEDFANVWCRWMRTSLRDLVTLFVEEFGDELISIVLYASATKRHLSTK